jgi:hypothetical protein
MARPQKEGLDYFPLDTDMDLKDDKVQLVEAKYGITGFGVLVKLLMKIYSEGYYYQWGENEGLLFSKRVNVDINTVNDIVTDLVKWGMFDADIFKKYGVLTSNGIQKRFWEVAKRRNDVIIKKEFWIHNVDIILVSANINLINVDTSTQRKEKESKVKESKEKNNTRAREEKNQPQKIKFADFVSLTNAEYEALVAKLGEEATKRCIEILDNYKGATGKKYKSDYRAILNWVVNRYEEEQYKKQRDKPKTNNPFLEIAKEEGLL